MRLSILKRYLPAGIFFGFICYLILLRDLNQKNLIIHIGQSVPFGDKIGHFFLFGMLAYLLNVAARLYKVRFGKLNIYFAPLIVLGFAVTEEFSQILFPTRTFDLIDMLFDVLGIVSFTLVSHLWHRVKPKVKPVHLLN